MKLYAIIDEESGLFVTYHTVSRLDDLGSQTKLFNSLSSAQRFIENPLIDEFSDTPTKLQCDLAWDLLEKIYDKDRWNINISIALWKDALAQFKHLQVVELDMMIKQKRRAKKERHG